MISLKRNSRNELAPAPGVRSQARYIYTPGQKEDFKISRSKFSDFLACQRCFYMDRVLGFISPSTPGWSLNSLTDALLKKEFDVCREEQTPHRLFLDNGLDHLVPLKHEEMDKWRDSLRHGLMSRFEESNIILSGGVDDIWQDTRTGELVVADYKSQATERGVNPNTYFAYGHHHDYKIQLEFYAFLLRAMNFPVSEVAYLLIVNGRGDPDGFNGEIKFSETLISYKHDCNWIPEKVNEMIEVLNNKQAPEAHPSCENCAYARQRAGLDIPF